MLLPQKMGNVARAVLDPLPAFNFIVVLVDVSGAREGRRDDRDGGDGDDRDRRVHRVQRARVVDEPEEYREGGSMTVLQFPQRVTWSNVRLRRGVDRLGRPLELVLRVRPGRGQAQATGSSCSRTTSTSRSRRGRFKRGIPVKWTGPSLNAGAEPGRGRGDRDRSTRGSAARLGRAPASPPLTGGRLRWRSRSASSSTVHTDETARPPTATGARADRARPPGRARARASRSALLAAGGRAASSPTTRPATSGAGPEGRTRTLHAATTSDGTLDERTPIALPFNPTEYTLSKGAQFAEIRSPGSTRRSSSSSAARPRR